MKPTAEYVRQRLDYDPSTGRFIWKIAHKHLIGKTPGKINRLGYHVITLNRIAYGAHCLAWLYVYGEWPQGQIDHKDGTPGHNWIENLRLATASQNAANRRAQNGHAVKGITKHKDGKWQAQIKKDNRNYYLGLFCTIEEANEAYRLKAIELFGEFARGA